MHQPKDTDWLGGWKHVYVCTSTYHITLPESPQILCNYFILLTVFPLWLAIVIVFYFFIWLLIVKTDQHLLLLWLCNYYSLNTTLSWLANRKTIELFLWSLFKIQIHIRIILRFFWKIQMPGIAFFSRTSDMFLMSSRV